MKTLKNYLIKESVNLDVDDVVSAIADYLDGDEFPMDAHSRYNSNGWDAADANGWWDVIEFCAGWTELADNLDVDEEDLYDFAEEHYDEIDAALEKYRD